MQLLDDLWKLCCLVFLFSHAVSLILMKLGICFPNTTGNSDLIFVLTKKTFGNGHIFVCKCVTDCRVNNVASRFMR